VFVTLEPVGYGVMGALQAYGVTNTSISVTTFDDHVDIGSIGVEGGSEAATLTFTISMSVPGVETCVEGGSGGGGAQTG
jgi:hypothetical protein